ncbi:MAG: LTA synthase family protein [Bacteroidales bacterium]
MWNKFITSTLKAREYLLQSYLVLLSNFALLMLLFSIQRLLFYLFNRSFFPDISFAQLSYIFFGGLRYDLSALLWANIAYIVLYLIPFKFRFHTIYQSILKGFFLFINTIMLLLNSGDWIYFKYILRRTAADVFQEFATEGNKAILLKQFIIDYWYVAVIWILLSVSLSIFYCKPKAINIKNTLKANLNFYIGSSLILFCVFGLSIAGMRGGFDKRDRPMSLNESAQYVSKPLEMSIVQNTPFCIFRTLGKKRVDRITFFDTNEELEAAYNPIFTPSNSRQTFTPMNVVIIIWESLSREHIGALNKHLQNGNYQGFTPFLDTLVEQGLSFAASYANGRKSMEALPSIFGSLPSMQVAYVVSPYVGNQLNSLGSLLKRRGYSASFFHGSSESSMHIGTFAKALGNKFYGQKEYGNDAHFDGSWGIWDEEFLQFMVQQLEREKEPFFTSVFTLSSHHPFKLPARYAEIFKDEGNEPMLKCIRYTDYALRKFFDEAKKQSWYNNTLFVITADHANHHIFPESQNTAAQMSVPVIYFAPNGSLPRGIVDGITQQTDIMPTVLGLLNYDEPFIAFGQNALSNPKENFAVNFVNGVYQAFYRDYVLHFDGTKTIAVYNIVADKMLQNNIIGENMDMQTLIEQKTKGFIQQYNNRIIDNCMTVDCQKYNSHE